LEYDAKSSSSDTASSSETSEFHAPTVYGKKPADTTCTSSSTVIPSSPTTEIFSYSARSSIPYSASSNAAPISTSSSASSYAAPSSSSTSSSASSYVALSSSSTSSSASPSSTTANSTIIANGDKWAFCYTPYASDGNCKTADAVATDIASIKAKGFTSVRLYASDCDGPQNIGAAAAKQGLKLILGIWIDESGIGSNTDTQIETLTKWGKDQAGFVNDVRSKFRAAGYTGPVGTSEVPGTLIQYADVLCPAIDFVGANVHPFFDANVEASGAGDFVVKMLDKVSKACNDEKVAYNLESGWPSLGSANGLAAPGAEDQKIAINSIMEKAGGKTAMFSFDDDAWKAPGEFGVEQHWGCADVFE
jgi:exo-beta-1,3-glucanase (GH17 family)